MHARKQEGARKHRRVPEPVTSHDERRFSLLLREEKGRKHDSIEKKSDVSAMCEFPTTLTYVVFVVYVAYANISSFSLFSFRVLTM